MADQRLKDLRGPGRREFLRWSATVAAALGLERARFLDALSGSAGVAMADSASCASTMRSVHFNAGNGALSRFTLLWPQNLVATGAATNTGYALHTATVTAAPTDKTLYYTPQSPFQTLAKTRQISAYCAGTNQTHTKTPSTAIATGTEMIAACAAIQQANPTLLPVIGVNPITYGTASGAPSVATVANAQGMVDLFNSAASKTLLNTPSNAALNEAYYKAFLGLNAAAGNPAVVQGYTTGKVAINLLGQNLAAQLTPTATDNVNYGISGSSSTAFVQIATSLITAVKAFKLGLTSMVAFPCYDDDPHGLFAGGTAQALADTTALGKAFDAFMADCAATPDPSCSSKTLADTIVMTIQGDTTKNGFQSSGWPDGTPGNSNVIYVFGNGFLKTGWFGGYNATKGCDGFDPATGNLVPGQASSVTTNAACAAAAFAVAKGDMRRVQDFYRGTPIDGIVNLQQM